jgi:hypothetical protein
LFSRSSGKETYVDPVVGRHSRHHCSKRRKDNKHLHLRNSEKTKKRKKKKKHWGFFFLFNAKRGVEIWPNFTNILKCLCVANKFQSHAHRSHNTHRCRSNSLGKKKKKKKIFQREKQPQGDLERKPRRCEGGKPPEIDENSRKFYNTCKCQCHQSQIATVALSFFMFFVFFFCFVCENEKS